MGGVSTHLDRVGDDRSGAAFGRRAGCRGASSPLITAADTVSMRWRVRRANWRSASNAASGSSNPRAAQEALGLLDDHAHLQGPLELAGSRRGCSSSSAACRTTTTANPANDSRHLAGRGRSVLLLERVELEATDGLVDQPEGQAGHAADPGASHDVGPHRPPAGAARSCAGAARTTSIGSPALRRSTVGPRPVRSCRAPAGPDRRGAEGDRAHALAGRPASIRPTASTPTRRAHSSTSRDSTVSTSVERVISSATSRRWRASLVS